MEISIVVPVYRSRSTLVDLHRRLVGSVESIGVVFEVILVEDCGPDDSWDVICDIASKDARVLGIKLSRNFGQHAATICGISNACGEWVVTLDDDLEHRPESIPDLYAKAKQGFDLVYGTYQLRTHSVYRNGTSFAARWLFSKAISTLNYEYTSFRIIRRSIAHELRRFDSPFPFIDGYLSWLTSSIASVEVPHGVRQEGSSNYTFSKLLKHMINIFVTFSDLPLKFASYLGVVSFFGGMSWLCFILYRFLVGGISVSGFASVMVAILLFGGIQLLMLGIFGEYLSRVNFKTSNKPLFLIGQSTRPAGACE